MIGSLTQTSRTGVLLHPCVACSSTPGEKTGYPHWRPAGGGYERVTRLIRGYYIQVIKFIRVIGGLFGLLGLLEVLRLLGLLGLFGLLGLLQLLRLLG